MTREEAARIIKECKGKGFKHTFYTLNEYHTALDMAIKALEQQEAIEECTCCEYRVGGECCYAEVEQKEDCISREVARRIIDSGRSKEQMLEVLNNTPSVNPQPKTGHCKDCKYYDRVANVDGIPLIVAHEFCSRWGYGCKTREDGYCFLFELQESEETDADSD